MDKIWGLYRHFKGRNYELYCLAEDEKGERYALYRMCYGDESFWIRPYEMFFGEKEQNGELIRRFAPTEDRRKTASEQMEKLRELKPELHHSETEELYEITELHPDSGIAKVRKRA